MLFGLENKHTNVQRAMYVVLAIIMWQHALVYIDDTIILSPTSEVHNDNIESVLRMIKRAGMTLKLKECYFFSDSIDYLRHVIMPEI